MPERKHNLLVVDDEYLNRDMLRERLVRSGFDVTEAEDARQAWDLIQKGGIDLVLLDTMMPGMSGIELLKMLRGVYGQSELPVIMATAVSDSASVAGALETGANDYVSKPIDYPVALARIRSQLKRKNSEQHLRQNAERHALVNHANADGIWDWDLDLNQVYYSQHWWLTIGVDHSGTGDAPEVWLDRVHPEDAANLRHRLHLHWSATGEQPFYCEYRMLHQDGSYRWMRSRGHSVRDSDGRAIRMIGSQTDITEQKVHDSLTGLANRLLFLDRAGQSLDAAMSGRGGGFAVLFLDIDRFKLVNDTMGHLAGDQLLVEVAARLRKAAPANTPADSSQKESDVTVGRFGGDEFAILLDHVEACAEAEAFAARLQRAFEEPFDLNGREVYCSVSIGIAAWNHSYTSVEDLLRDADTAMYGAKANGGSGYLVFDEPMRQRVAARLEIETSLRKAVERNELVVYYQPKVDLERGSIVGMEALLRWRHPRMGLIGPADFIPIAEETGQIVGIGNWAIREACRQMVEWQKEYPAIPPLAISVNLSVRQFRQPDVAQRIAAILNETGLEPGCLQLEITESVVMDDPDGAIEITHKLKNLGVGIKLDDFGTGYSSLSYLCRMPIDTLKIDKSFIIRMRESKTDLEIVRTVLTLARSLGMEVVAEGVERIDQLTQLRSLGCRFGQGYYFGRPISTEETGLLLASSQAESGWIEAHLVDVSIDERTII